MKRPEGQVFVAGSDSRYFHEFTDELAGEFHRFLLNCIQTCHGDESYSGIKRSYAGAGDFWITTLPYPFFSATISFTPTSFQTIDRSSLTIASGGSTGE